MPKKQTVIIGKLLRRIARLKGGGSALPGLWVEKLEPTFLQDTLGQLPQGIIVVSGTNGKTTTTKMLAELLSATGLRVFTNRTGSNFTRGVVSAILEAINLEGKLDYDVAVLELDEAHAVHFVKQVPPRISLFLNVMRDQLDRFGEVDTTARLLQKVADATTEAVILNRDDPLIAGIAKTLPTNVKKHYFGVTPHLRQLFVNDDELKQQAKSPLPKAMSSGTADAELVSFKKQTIQFKLQGKTYEAPLQVRGVYNFLNAIAALAAARVVRQEAPIDKLLEALRCVAPAFGRGEQALYKGEPIELVLIKNPAGFRLALESAKEHANKEAIMVAINDNFADGRDMSWLWDVDFTTLHKVSMVSGIRAYDMALRLQYDMVPISVVETDLKKALNDFFAKNTGKPMRIYCSYTAMLKIRSLAAKKLHLEQAL